MNRIRDLREARGWSQFQLAQAADTSQPVTPTFLKKMREVGVTTIIRYFDHKNETFKNKTLTFEERMQIAEAGFHLVVVFQHWGQRISTFRDHTRGKADAIRALTPAMAQ